MLYPLVHSIRWACLLGILLGGSTHAASSDTIDFNRDVRPILNNKCMGCHGGVRQAGGISVQYPEDILGKGKSGEICVVPGKPEASELIRRIVTTDHDDRMPKEKPPLSQAEIEILTRWVTQGAKWGDHWAFLAPEPTATPSVKEKNWPTNLIDNFILARLESEKLTHAVAADKATLLRRVTLDLTGLPPTPEELNSFLTDTSANAYERVVDRLLASARFGERWASMWMDLSRYGDTKSLGHDGTRDIWPYRDWIIAAFNSDMRWDDFIVRQMAGDMLPEGQQDLIATGFHRLTKNNDEGGTIDEEYRIYAVIDRVNTTWTAFMGVQMGCVQCHGHPYDPIRAKEYYGSFAFLNQSEDSDKDDDRPTIKIAEKPDEVARITQLIAQTQALISNKSQTPKPIQWTVSKPSRTISSAKDTQFATDANGLVTVTGKREPTSVTEITLPAPKSQNLSAITLHTGNPKKAGGASGRHPDGNFVLSGVEVSRVTPNAPAPQGRFFRIDIPGAGKCANVSEIELLDANGVNVARKATATQSSTSPGYPATIAIDGKHSTGIDNTTSTDTQTDPWIQLDLGTVTRVQTIRIWNRMDGGNDARILGAILSLRDAGGKVVWSRRIPAAPTQQLLEFAITQPEVALEVSQAKADYEQPSYPASAVLSNPMPGTLGWAVGPKRTAEHRLVLSLNQVTQLGAGEQIRVRLHHLHTKPGLDGMDLAQFSLSVTDSPEVIEQTSPEQMKLADLRKELAKLPIADMPIMRELPKDKQRKTHELVRGGWNTPGEVIAAPFTPGTLPAMGKDLPKDRLGFARWIASSENPLTARVAVNHFWRELFGTGLVATAEDFGTMGEKPSHPELLDTLAYRFTRDLAWSPKRLIREMVLSSTYRQSSAITADAMERDPSNRLLARGSRKRLTGEMVRDQALAVSGLLNVKLTAGTPFVPPSPGGYLRNAFRGSPEVSVDQTPGRLRRSVYAYWKRLEPFATLTIFDASDRDSCSARRFTTNSPLQALTTLNEEVLVEAQKEWAKRLAATPGDDNARIRSAYLAMSEVTPSETQIKALSQLLKQARTRYQSDTAFTQAAKLTAEQAAWWQVTTVLFNTDSALSRN